MFARQPTLSPMATTCTNCTAAAGCSNTRARRAHGHSLDNNRDTKEIVAGGGKPLPAARRRLDFQVRGRTPEWQPLDDNKATVKIVADGNNLYQLHNDGWVFKYTGTSNCTPAEWNRCWQAIGSDKETKDIIASGGSIYRRQVTGRFIPTTAHLQTAGRYLTITQRQCRSSPMGPSFINGTTTEGSLSATVAGIGGHSTTTVTPKTLSPVAGISTNATVTGGCSGTQAPPMTGWEPLDNNEATVQMVAGNRFYQRHKSH